MKIPPLFWKLTRIVPVMLYRYGFGSLIQARILLLETTGRRTGITRRAPLQYERQGDEIFVGSARGIKSDWYRNIVANPEVRVHLGRERWSGLAEVVSDAGRLADFLSLRLERQPRFVGQLLKFAGFSEPFTREDLEAYSEDKAMVILRPQSGGSR